MKSLAFHCAATIFIITSILVVVAALVSAAHGVLTPAAREKVRADVVLAPIPREHLHGHWIMGADNHAYWCWGPTITLGSWNEMPKKYALDCEGPHSQVVVHD